jgi:hypothetical protein
MGLGQAGKLRELYHTHLFRASMGHEHAIFPENNQPLT